MGFGKWAAYPYPTFLGVPPLPQGPPNRTLFNFLDRNVLQSPQFSLLFQMKALLAVSSSVLNIVLTIFDQGITVKSKNPTIKQLIDL